MPFLNADNEDTDKTTRKQSMAASRWFYIWRLFSHCLFLISPYFGASGRMWLCISWVSSLLFEPAHDKIYDIRLLLPAKTQISMRIREVWSETSLVACAFYSLQDIQRGLNKNPFYTGWMYRLIGVFAGDTTKPTIRLVWPAKAQISLMPVWSVSLQCTQCVGKDLGVGVGLGGNSEKFWAGCAAGTLNTSPIRIISRLTKHTYSYNFHFKNIPYSYKRRILVKLVEPKQTTY